MLFLHALQDYDIRSPTEFATFLKGVLRKGLWAYLRRELKKARRELTPEQARDLEDYQVYLSRSLRQTFEESEAESIDRIDLSEALEILTTQEKSIVTQYYYENKSQKRIAKALKISRQAVAKTLKRALKKMRKFLQ